MDKLMDSAQLMDELARLQDELAGQQVEIEALRHANAALERQMTIDAQQADGMLSELVAQSDALKKANLHQLAQNNFIQRVMDTASPLLIVLGPDGRLKQVNKHCANELEALDKPLTDCVLDDWLSPYDSQQLANALPELPWTIHSPLFETVRRSGAYAAEHRLVGRDGKYRSYWLEATIQHSPQGKEEGAVICATDITAIKQQENLIRKEKLFKEVQRIAQLGHWELDIASGEFKYSDEFYRILKVESTLLTPSFKDYRNVIHPEDRDIFAEAYKASLKTRQPCGVDHRLQFPNGQIKWVHERFVTRYDEDGRPLRSIATVQDITSQREVEEQTRLAASVFDNSLNGILITNAKATILRINQAFSDIMGYSPDEVVGQKAGLFKSGRHDDEFYRELWRSLREQGKWQGEIWNRRSDGRIIPLWQNITSVRDSSGRIMHYIGAFYDLSEQKQSAEHIYRLAYYDTLTGLPNRQFCGELCDRALAHARRSGLSLAVLFLDLDRFKHVNDSLGHPVGDDLLRAVSQRLCGCVREEDTVARLGGDEFVILLANVSNALDVERVARKIISAITQPFNVEGHKLDIGTSIGISRFPTDGNNATTLIKHADLAMYEAKEHGRGSYRFYETKLTERVNERLFLESELRDAINWNELSVLYQPQFSLTGNKLVGAEALVRWNHRDKGLISPEKFIPIAEDSDLIVAVGEWVLLNACRQAKTWLDAGQELQRMAVNLSVAQIERSDILTTVRHVLHETGLPPERLELEITETAIIRQRHRDFQVLEQLRAMGIALAIDDFGTGQTSLSYLKQLPVTKLKIDRSFVMDIPQDNNDITITRAILSLGHSMGLTVLAEGVETIHQLNLLKSLECDEVQGYYFSRPVDARRFQIFFGNTNGGNQPNSFYKKGLINSP
ncbi:MAG: sensor domain-containing protein [Gammaproteobacteria bacterium]